MKTECFNYCLPKELIAQTPCPKRDEARLMVLYRDTGEIFHKRFFEIVDFLESGDALVVNDTKVIPARIFGKDKKIREVLLIKEVEPLVWETFIKPQRGLKVGEELVFNNDSINGKVKRRTEDGTYILELSNDLPLSSIGYAPLPPYIKRDYPLTPSFAKASEGRPTLSSKRRGSNTREENLDEDIHNYDKERYQTVYARSPGAIAAPTAGMHFTEELLTGLKNKGIKIAPITLHVGVGTFRPVRAENINDHKMLPEWFKIPIDTTRAIKNAKRIIAVGTTTARTLETSIEGTGWTDLFIYPPFEFKAVDGLITNFHLPKSTLLMLVSAFAGRDFILKAYSEAIEQKYRFYSYGDAMLIM